MTKEQFQKQYPNAQYSGKTYKEHPNEEFGGFFMKDGKFIPLSFIHKIPPMRSHKLIIA